DGAGELRRGRSLDLSPEFKALYSLNRLLGSGAMGMVYRATQLSVGRQVAVKFLLRAESSEASEMLARFLLEARLMAKVSHPNVVQVFDVGMLEEHPYLVSEYVPGGTLRRHLRETGALHPSEAVRLITMCLAGLAACHDAGIVHRDLKPENLLLTPTAVVKVADLGVARSLDRLGGLTHAGALIGTPLYMAPEQLRGEPAGFAADLYAVGAILYEMLTGSRPFRAANLVELSRRHATEHPRPLRELAPLTAPGLAEAVHRSLAMDPDERPGSAGQFAEELAAAMMLSRPRSQRAARSSPRVACPAPASPPARNRSIPAIAALVAAVLGAVLWGRPGPLGSMPRGSVTSGAPRPSLPPVASSSPADRPTPAGAAFDGLVPLGKNEQGYEQFESKKDGAVMVRVPAGRFLMGSSSGKADERTVHEVDLDAFLIDKFEVTNARYGRFLAATGHRKQECWNDPRFNAAQQPVVGVSWTDALVYCSWAGKRLPTEAEWERAARGGLEQKPYPWGDKAPEGRACYGCDLLTGHPAPVGRFPPNGFGLHDLAGSVWEWCADWYGADYYPNSPGRNPQGPASGRWRVARGGSWDYFDASLLTCHRRSRDLTTFRSVNGGFRCARDG
ncbi:MAG: SUMF1/EgtB/PvdO family nonheme iron enzyme, partial [Candidatus Riflebacteria bacterium]|nr:SUMF1/EgtB/PvdO family nonheme iron enzyme [Candidatus Riflebacteria bacterium]